MEPVWIRLLEISPIAGAMLAMCWMFLRSLEVREDKTVSAMEKRDSLIQANIEKMAETHESALDKRDARLSQMVDVGQKLIEKNILTMSAVLYEMKECANRDKDKC